MSSSNLNSADYASDQTANASESPPADTATSSTESTVKSPEVFQQPVALNAPSLNAIIDQAVGTLPGTVASSGWVFPNFVPATGSISGCSGV